MHGGQKQATSEKWLVSRLERERASERVRASEPASEQASQPASEQAVVSKRRITGNSTVQVQNMFRFVRQIDEPGNRNLHAKRQFVLLDSCPDFRIIDRFELLTIQLVDCIQRATTCFGAKAVRIRHIKYRVTLRSQSHTLMRRRQKAATPIARL